ncbi:MAG: Rnf-Nqr domain containing protein [bacterium]
MNELVLIFHDSVLINNIVLTAFIGALLIIVETPKFRDSFSAGLRLSAPLALIAYLGWIFTHRIPAVYNNFLPGIYFLNSLLGIHIIKKSGLLREKWIRNLPGSTLGLVYLVAFQLFIREQTGDQLADFFLILGSVLGFYLLFIIIAGIKEQLNLNESDRIYRSEYVILLAMAFLAAVISGFELG